MGKNKNRPPEGRREKHHKPLIPVSAKPAPQMIERREPSPSMPGSVKGMGVARRPLFQTDTSRPSWALDMLIAIASAKQLGVQTFEIAVAGTPARPRPAANSWSFLYGPSTDDEEWKSKIEGVDSARITIYAVVVE